MIATADGKMFAEAITEMLHVLLNPLGYAAAIQKAAEDIEAADIVAGSESLKESIDEEWNW